MAVGRIVACIGIVVVAGRYLLNPFLALLASTGAREVMTAAALLVVLAAAERLSLQQVEGITAARELIYARMVQPEPLSMPMDGATALNEEAKDLVGEEAEAGPIRCRRGTCSRKTLDG